MCHVAHILVCALIGLGVFDCANTATDNPIIPKSLLSTISTNVANVLSPSLIRELHDRYTSRKDDVSETNAAVIQPTTLPPTTTLKPKTRSSTTRTPRTRKPTTIATNKVAEAKALDEFDLARAPQTQLENQFPFDFRNNNFRDFSSTGLQAGGRQFNGPFGQNPFGSDGFRGFSSGIDGTGVNGAIQGLGGRFGSSGFNGNRPFNSDSLDFDGRFQDFGRFGGFGGGFGGGFDGSNRFFDQGFRSGGFANFPGQHQDDRNNLIQNFRGDLRTNAASSLTNDQTNQLSQSFAGAFPQNYAQNSFDLLQSQRFQNPYAEGFDRNQQRGPSFPLFYPLARPNDAPVNPASPAAASNAKQNDAATGPAAAASRRSEEAQPKTANSNVTDDVNAAPKEQDERNQFVRLYYPPLDDYSDVRVNPDVFKHSIASNIVDKKSKNNIV